MSDDEMVDVTITIQELNSLSRKQIKLKNAFQSAKSADQSLKAFKRMESSFRDSDLGLPCWNLAEYLLDEARPEEALVFGKRSLKIFLSNMNTDISCFGNYCPAIFTYSDDKGVSRTCSVIHNSSFFVAAVCNVLGNACVELKRYDEGLSYLNWANRNLTELERDRDEIRCNGKCVMSNIFSLIPKGKEKEEIPYLLDLVEKLKVSFGPEHVEVGYGYAYMGAAYWNLGQRELSLQFLADAKGIIDATIGPNHVNSLNTSQILATSYAAMGRYDLAIVIQQKVVEGFKALGPSEEEFLEKAVVCLDKMKEEVAESSTSLLPQFEDDGDDLSAMISKCEISGDETEIK